LPKPSNEVDVPEIDPVTVADRARVSLITRAVLDPVLPPEAVLVLLVLARYANKLNHSVSFRYRDLELETKLRPGVLVKSLDALKQRRYVVISPGRPTTFRLLPLRAVSGGI
jgi:hypothetical protein